jgi:multicomponent Na+:H+ antiporter subunit E
MNFREATVRVVKSVPTGLRQSGASTPPPATEHMIPTRRVFSTLAVLSILWLVLSGFFELLLLSFGVASCLLVAWLAARMDRTDGEHHFGLVRPLAGLRYLGWLTLEVIKSNLDVCRRILSPRLPITPTVVWVPASQKTEIGRVIFANSITLTPGTVSIDVQEGEIEVHALSKEGADALLEGEMNRRVQAIEWEG